MLASRQLHACILRVLDEQAADPRPQLAPAGFAVFAHKAPARLLDALQVRRTSDLPTPSPFKYAFQVRLYNPDIPIGADAAAAVVPAPVASRKAPRAVAEMDIDERALRRQLSRQRTASDGSGAKSDGEGKRGSPAAPAPPAPRVTRGKGGKDRVSDSESSSSATPSPSRRARSKRARSKPARSKPARSKPAQIQPARSKPARSKLAWDEPAPVVSRRRRREQKRGREAGDASASAGSSRKRRA